MGTLNDWDVIDANNNATPPDGWPENTMNYSDVNNTGRAVQGTMKRFFADVNGSLDAAGAADAYTLTLNETGYTAYFDGMWFACSIPAANTITNPTIDVNGIGAVTIVDREGNALSIGELKTGGVYDFRYDGTNMRIVGSGGVAGLDTQFQYNDGGAFAGASGLTYNSGTDEVTLANPVNVLTDLVLTEQADHTSTPGPGFGYLWVRNDNPSILIFTDDAGVDTQVGTVGTTLPGGVDTNLQYNNGGIFGGIGEWTWDDAQLILSGLTLATTDPALAITGDNLTAGYAVTIDVGAAGNIGVGGALRVISDTGGGTVDFGAAGYFITRNASAALRAEAQTVVDGRAFQAYANVNNRTEPVALIENDAAVGTSVSVALEVQNDSPAPHIELTGVNGEGIKFTSNQISTDPNTLDYYEEGTTTAYLDTNSFGDGQSDGQTYGANNNVWYTRIGRIVFIQGRLQTTSIGSLSGSPVFIVFDPQLPWLFGEATNYHFGISDATGMAKGADHSINGYFSGLSGAIALERSDVTGGMTLLTAAQVASGSDLFFTGWYQVNSA